MVWNDHDMILFIKVKVVIIKGIRDGSWFQLSIELWMLYFYKVYNEFNYYLKIDIEMSGKQ